jgi:hypothetical protein
MARWFLRLGALYILLAAALGVLMLALPLTRGLTSAHAHLALLGGGGLILAGLVYQTEDDRFRRSWAILHMILANLGLWGLAIYLGLSAYLAWPWLIFLGVTAGVVNVAAWLIFVVNLWVPHKKTADRRPPTA